MKHLWLLVFVFLLACSGSKSDGDSIRVSVLRGPTAIAFAEWIECPPMLNGKKVLVDIVDSPQQIQAALIKKSTDIAALPMISAANLYNKGIDYYLSGCPVWGNLYIIGKENAGRLHLFGAGTTPDILARYYLDKRNQDYELAYALGTAGEIAQGILAGKVEAAVLGEPFVSIVLNRDTAIHILADLNDPGNLSPGFPQTAIMVHPDLKSQQQNIDKLIQSSCVFAVENPGKVIDILEKQDLFSVGMLTPSTIERCRIIYLPASDIKEDIESYLKIVYEYEPQAIGGKLPDSNFY